MSRPSHVELLTDAALVPIAEREKNSVTLASRERKMISRTIAPEQERLPPLRLNSMPNSYAVGPDAELEVITTRIQKRVPLRMHKERCVCLNPCSDFI